MLVAWATCWALKAATGRPRPYQVLDGARLVAAVAPSGSSFPSSHTALAVYTAATASHLLGLGGTRAAGAYALALLVAFSRIYLGAHYPSDVLAGAAIGLGAALGARCAPGRLPAPLDRFAPPG
jgi:undecaprenyl-diphosphatase